MTIRTSSGLLRVLGTAFGLSVGLGNMIGSGIFRTPGAIVGHTGTLSLAALLIVAGGIQALLSANLWAEVATSVALSGGSVVVIRRAFGDTAAMIIGWTDALGCVAGTAQAAAAAAGFLAIVLPTLSGHIGVTAAVLLFLFATINWAGVIVGEITQMIASALQALLVLGVAALLFWVARLPAPSGASPATPVVTGAGMIVGYQLVYGTFVGWNNAAYFAEETKDLGRAVPRALGWSIIAFGGLYLAMLLGLGHALPITLLSGESFPAKLALGQALGPIGITILSAIAFAALVTCMNSGIMPGSRVFFALGKAAYGPGLLTRVNRGGTPDVALFLLTGLGVALVLTGSYETIFMLMGTLALTVTTAMDAAFFVLRRREPDLARPFRALGYPVLPVIALICDIGFLVTVASSDLRGTAYALTVVAFGLMAAHFSASYRAHRLAAP
jgi:APA family basic amino acid/polyamine antiporter